MKEVEKKLLKISRETSIELRHKVFILYDGNTYGNLGNEIEEAIRNHIKVLDQKIAEKNAKKLLSENNSAKNSEESAQKFEEHKGFPEQMNEQRKRKSTN